VGQVPAVCKEYGVGYSRSPPESKSRYRSYVAKAAFGRLLAPRTE